MLIVILKKKQFFLKFFKKLIKIAAFKDNYGKKDMKFGMFTWILSVLAAASLVQERFFWFFRARNQ
jgi:hypothetical protein